MAKDIVTKAEILGGEIDVRANFGQTVKVTVSPDPYMGDTEVTPSDQTQVLQTKKKFVQDDITVYPAATEYLSTDHNGTFTPSDGKVGFSQVTVDVQPDLRPLSVSENGTYQPDGFDGFSEVEVNVQGMDVALFTKGDYPFGDVRFPDDITQVVSRLSYQSGITSIDLNNVRSVKYISAFEGCTGIETFRAPELLTFGGSMFQSCTSLYAGQMMDLSVIAPKCQTLDSRCFQDCNMSEIRLPQTLKKTNTYSINRNSNLTKVYFTGKPNDIVLGGATFDTVANLRDIYVPWSEGEVANAPWGASRATIHYDTVYDEDGNVVSST